jgi:hypothetical protein
MENTTKTPEQLKIEAIENLRGRIVEPSDILQFLFVVQRNLSHPDSKKAFKKVSKTLDPLYKLYEDLIKIESAEFYEMANPKKISETSNS